MSTTNEEKEVYIETQIDTKQMYEFMLNHTYKSLMGIVGVLLSIMAVIFLVVYWGKYSPAYKALFFLIALMFTVINPVMLYLKSKKQVKANDSFQHPLCYTLSGKGIEVVQGENSLHIEWDDIIKVSSTKNLVIIYLSPVRAFIFPKVQIGEKFEEFKHMIADNIRCRKVTVK